MGSVRSSLNEADRCGLKVVLVMQDLINPMKAIDRKLLMTEGKAKIEPFVKEAMKHKSLIAYYLVDEPQDKDAYEYAAALKKIFAEIDPTRFSFTAGTWPKLNIKTMIDNVPMPVAMPESYPVWIRPYKVGIGDFRYQLFTNEWYEWEGSKTDAYDSRYIKDLADAYDILQSSIKGRAVLWPLVAAFQQPTNGPWDWRLPTPEELRCMTGIALAKGAKGIFFFAYCVLGYVKGDYPTLMPEIENQSKRLRKLGSILLKCEHVKMNIKISGGGSQVYGAGLAEAFKSPDGSIYLMLVNRNCVPTSKKDVLTVTMDMPQKIKPFRVYDVENRVPVNSKRLNTDKWQLDTKLDTGDYILIKL